MAKAKQVLDVRVSKGITTSQSNEHQRRWTEKGWEQALEKGNYDPSREHLNFEIVSGKVRPVDKSRSIPERMAEILDRRGIKDPNEGLDEPKYRTVVNIIFGGSRDRMRELAFGSQKVNFDKGRTIPTSSGSATSNAGRRMSMRLSAADTASRTSPPSLYTSMK